MRRRRTATPGKAATVPFVTRSCAAITVRQSKVRVDEATGELTVREPFSSVGGLADLPAVLTLQVRAYDLGVPHLHGEATVDVYTQVCQLQSQLIIVLLTRSTLITNCNQPSIECNEIQSIVIYF